jgi:hypothetical protein
MDVGEVTRARELLGNRHAAISRIPLQNKDLEACLGEIAGPSQAIVPGADDNGFYPAGIPITLS